jgi:hypothetical protein
MHTKLSQKDKLKKNSIFSALGLEFSWKSANVTREHVASNLRVEP